MPTRPRSRSRCSARSTNGLAARGCFKPSGRVVPAVAKRRAGTHSAACRVRGSRIGLSGRPGRPADWTDMNVHHQSAKPNGAPPPRSVHPGSGRRKTRETPKGRQVDPQALDEVRALLGDRPRRADLLIEHLHLLQDRYGCLHAGHLVALAEEMRLALAEVYEVASFYAHFDIVMDDEAPPPPITVRVCDSLSCALFGGENLLEDLRSRLGDAVRVARAPCMGGCDKAPVVAIGHALHEHATVDNVAAAIAAGHTHPEIPTYTALDAYRAGGGYQLLQASLGGQKSVE